MYTPASQTYTFRSEVYLHHSRQHVPRTQPQHSHIHSFFLSHQCMHTRTRQSATAVARYLTWPPRPRPIFTHQVSERERARLPPLDLFLSYVMLTNDQLPSYPRAASFREHFGHAERISCCPSYCRRRDGRNSIIDSVHTVEFAASGRELERSAFSSNRIHNRKTVSSYPDGD